MSDHSTPPKFIVVNVSWPSGRHRAVVAMHNMSVKLEAMSTSALDETVWVPAGDHLDTAVILDVVTGALARVFMDLPPFSDRRLYPRGVQRIGDRIEINI